MQVLLRAVCCGYLVFYVIIPLIRDSSDENSISPTLRIAIIVVFSVLTAAIIIFTILEMIRNRKAGLYKATAYKDDVSEEDAEIKMKSAELEENDEYK